MISRQHSSEPLLPSDKPRRAQQWALQRQCGCQELFRRSSFCLCFSKRPFLSRYNTCQVLLRQQDGIGCSEHGVVCMRVALYSVETRFQRTEATSVYSATRSVQTCAHDSDLFRPVVPANDVSLKTISSAYPGITVNDDDDDGR